jgi:magnesium and cobalt exporter, CNNM family
VLLDKDGRWQDHLREPLCVPERVGLLDLLTTFREERTKMAVVVDEYGSVAGVVTLQDVLEEIVGDIYESHELPVSEISELEPERWRMAGSVDLDEAGKKLAVEFPEHKGRTVGGFVMNVLGRVARVGDEVQFEALTLTVCEMIGRRVHALDVRRSPEAPEPTRNGGRRRSDRPGSRSREADA